MRNTSSIAGVILTFGLLHCAGGSDPDALRGYGREKRASAEVDAGAKATPPPRATSTAPAAPSATTPPSTPDPPDPTDADASAPAPPPPPPPPPPTPGPFCRNLSTCCFNLDLLSGALCESIASKMNEAGCGAALVAFKCAAQ